MDMGIVNAGQLGVYEEIEPELRERVEDVVLNRRADATERLVEIAEQRKGAGGKTRGRPGVARRAGGRSAWRTPWCMASPSSSSKTPKKRAQIERAAAGRSRSSKGR